jgi:hypothetical protein
MNAMDELIFRGHEPWEADIPAARAFIVDSLIQGRIDLGEDKKWATATLFLTTSDEEVCFEYNRNNNPESILNCDVQSHPPKVANNDTEVISEVLTKRKNDQTDGEVKEKIEPSPRVPPTSKKRPKH